MRRFIKSHMVLVIWLQLTGIVVFLTSGCLTRMSIEKLAGESASQEFRLLDDRMPQPMLYWREAPRHIETALVLEPPLQDCVQVRMYINKSPDAPIQLTADSYDILPVRLQSIREELAYWSRIPASPCAMLLTVGHIEEEAFSGVSVSTSTDVIRRYGMVFQEDEIARHGYWLALPFDMFGDVFVIPFFLYMSAIFGTVEGPVEPVTVIFQLPDSTRRQTSLTSAEARRLLKDDFPQVLSVPLYPFKHVRVWVRAALVKLHMEFSEEAVGEVVTDEWIPEGLRLTMVDGVTGRWEFRLDTDTELQSDLSTWTGNSSLIRLQHVSNSVRLNQEEVEKHAEYSSVETRSLAKAGDAKAMYNIYLGKRDDYNEPVAAWGWLCTAADLEYENAQIEVAYWHRESNWEFARPDRVEWLRKAEIRADDRIAYLWYTLAAKGNDKRLSIRDNLFSETLSENEMAEAQDMVNNWKPGQCPRPNQ
jgi:hypothetical protein